MIGLDTNVLVRYLVQDDPEQSARATAAIENAIEAGERLHLNPIVLCELVWVLSGTYRVRRGEVADTLERLLETDGLEVEHKDRVRAALERYRAGRADFADYLIGRTNGDGGCTHTLTFDRALRSDDAFRIL